MKAILNNSSISIIADIGETASYQALRNYGIHLSKVRYLKRISMILVCISWFTFTACKAEPLQIKPERIEFFTDLKVFAIDVNGKYQIGTLDGEWSAIHGIKKKGLSLLDATVATDYGVYLVGSESHLDSEQDLFYTGLIVLIDSSNKTLKQWHHDSNFTHASVFNNQITMNSFDGIYRLGKDDVIQRVKENAKRQRLTSIRDSVGNLILCNSLLPTKNAVFTTGPAGCFKEDEWEFTGIWYPSDKSFNTDPIACGPWLIEPVQSQYKSPISGINVRDISNGALIKTFKASGVKRFYCINNSEILFDNQTQSYSLPEMDKGLKYSCKENEEIISIKRQQNRNFCLTSSGYMGRLQNR